MIAVALLESAVISFGAAITFPTYIYLLFLPDMAELVLVGKVRAVKATMALVPVELGDGGDGALVRVVGVANSLAVGVVVGPVVVVGSVVVVVVVHALEAVGLMVHR